MRSNKEEEDSSEPAASVLRMADLVEYHKAAVVSRTLIDEKTGTVTLFAFGKGQGLSEHTAPFDAMVYILDGKANVTIAGEHFTLSKGETIIMPANKPHALRAVSRFKMLLIMIRS